MFRFLLVLLFVAAVAAFGPSRLAPASSRKSSAPVPSKAVASPKVGTVKAKAGPVSKKFGKDMTWGGRPDPTPEIIVAGAAVPFASSEYTPKEGTSLGGFLEAPWRYNLRKD